MKVSALSVAAALVAGGLSASLAHADFDVSPRIAGGQVLTNAFQDATEQEVDNVRVFSYEFGETPGQPFFLPDPGYHPLPGSGFTSGSSVGFDLTQSLRYWSGVGSPGFSPVVTGESIRFDFGANSVVSTGGAVPSPGGYLFGAVDASGEFDDHLETFLLASGGTIGSPGTPADGVYLVTQQVTTDQAGVSPSAPIYLLFANNAAEGALDDAALFVRDTFAPGSNLAVVPEPASIAALAGLAIARRRRRI